MLFSTLGHTSQVIPSIMVEWGRGGGLMEPLLRVFDMLQYVEKILPSVESV